MASDNYTGSSTLVSGKQVSRFPRPNPSPPRADDVLMFRLVFEMLAFSYGVDRSALEKALHGSQLPVAVHSGERRSLLSHEDMHRAYNLGCIAASACESILQSTDNATDRSLSHELIQCVVEPARIIRIPPGYILEKLIEYKGHRCVPGREKESTPRKLGSTLITVFGHRIWPTRWMPGKQNIALARHLITDELVLPQGAEASRIICDGIARFRRKHCKPGPIQVPRITYIDPVATAVAEVLEKQAFDEQVVNQLLSSQRNHQSHKVGVNNENKLRAKESMGSLKVQVDGATVKKVIGRRGSEISMTCRGSLKRQNSQTRSFGNPRNGSVRGMAPPPVPKLPTDLELRQMGRTGR